jgi:phosphosulfolactate phosphohydrolase-like enzyme
VTPFDQSTAACRCEWGAAGHDNLAPAPVTIIVDVLSFSTCVDVAAGGAVAILPYDARSGSAEAFARHNHAELAGLRGVARYSLSPASFLGAAPGARCVLPSPNGAALATRAATRATVVIAGCLRNAAAPRLSEVIVQSSSGRELAERGYAQDVEIAVALDVSRNVPRFDGIAFVDDQITLPNSSL